MFSCFLSLDPLSVFVIVYLMDDLMQFIFTCYKNNVEKEDNVNNDE